MAGHGTTGPDISSKLRVDFIGGRARNGGWTIPKTSSNISRLNSPMEYLQRCSNAMTPLGADDCRKPAGKRPQRTRNDENSLL
jgi:hypothetical protein